MAATDPAECPPKRQKSPAEEVGTSGLEKEAVEAACTPNNDDERTPGKATESLGDRQPAELATRSEVTPGSGDGNDKSTSGNRRSDAGGTDGWGFDWSETEEDAQPKIHKQEKDGECGKLTLVMVFCQLHPPDTPSGFGVKVRVRVSLRVTHSKSVSCFTESQMSFDFRNSVFEALRFRKGVLFIFLVHVYF